MKICTQSVRFDVHDVSSCEAAPEILRFAHLVHPFESEHDVYPLPPPAVPNRANDNADPVEVLPPPLPSGDLDHADLPVPVPGSVASDLG